jgi:lactam utilization protein B
MTTMTELRFFDPSGVLHVSQSHARRLGSLAGKRIGLLSNEEWQADRSLDALGQALQADFPDAIVIDAHQLPRGNVALAHPDTVQALKALHIDAAIIGNAA